MRYLMREDTRLSTVAKNVYGDIVDTAYIGTLYYKDSDPTPTDYDTIDSYAGTETDQISNDKLMIVIQFTNGRKVLITNSEWGSIRIPESGELLF